MRIIFLIIVILHGLIHLLGFVKGIGLKEVKELTLPISKPLGFIWLASAFIFLAYGISFIVNYKYSWLIGFLAIAVSQILIILIWKDAKFGTIPNALIFIVSFFSWGYYSFQKYILEETQQLLSQNKIIENKIMTESEIQLLPYPVKNWIRHSGALGRPLISIGKVVQSAQLKLNPGQENWMNATAIQYTTIDKPAFIWAVDVKMNNIVSFKGRDKFENGNGEMLIKMNSLINIVNEQGEKLSEASLQRFLGEMVWFPSLALSPYISWEQINDTTARATMSYKGTSGSGTFYFNDKSDITKFTAFRYKDNNAVAKKHEWSISISDYKTFEGVKVPAIMSSTWKLDAGDWTWLKLEVLDIKYNDESSK